MSSSQDEQVLLIPPIGLPSQVDQTLDSCPQFRILIIGKSGVGKSSLVRYMFNVDPQKIDVAHDRAGDADIELEYQSPENPRFILHDSKGLEPGMSTNLNTVETFIRKCQRHPELSRRIHAIWLCLETPRLGARLLETGDENLMKLAIELKIPIVAVFTKFDLLVNGFIIKDKSSNKSKEEKRTDSEKKALESLQSSAENLEKEWKKWAPQDLSMDWVYMSLPRKPNPKASAAMLSSLADVTRKRLREVEGDLYITWSTAQQVNARQKVEISIEEGLKNYWKDLGNSVVFEGQTLINCIRRIHDDILKIWNLRDPGNILSSPEFFSEMIGLAEPLINKESDQTSWFRDQLSDLSNLTSIAQAVGAGVLAIPMSVISLSGLSIKFFYRKYQKHDSNAKFLAAYIMNLIFFLHSIFMDILPTEPPRTLSHNFVIDALASQKAYLQRKPSDNIDPTEEGIKREINNRLRLP